MENKARYTLVGLFILILGVSAVSFVLWQARYGLKDITSFEYRLYSKESIAGLNENSFVEYKGLNIGVIETIRIDPTNIERIEIILKITKPQIIKTDSYAVIQSQGITGNKRIQITGGTSDADILKSTNGDFAVIPIHGSFIDNIATNAQNIAVKIDKLLTKIDKLVNKQSIDNINDVISNANKASQNFTLLLNEQNIKNINSSMENIDKILKNFTLLVNEQNIKNINSSISNIDKASQNFDSLVSDMNGIVKTNIPNTFENIDTLTKNYSSLSNKIKQLIDKDISKLVNNADNTLKSTQNINDVISKLEDTIEKVDNTLDTLNENGGDLIFKVRDENYGPGELKNEN